MTVYKRGGVYHYEFVFQGRRYRGATGQVIKRDAEEVERTVKQRLRQRAAGIATGSPEETPPFQEWAEVYLAWKRPKLEDPESLALTLRVLLRFFGRRTASQRDQPGPYHDLRLGDVIADPSWIERFEAWMLARPHHAASTRNRLRSALSGLYRLATHPQFRARTQVQMNPMAGVWRDPTYGREVALRPEQVRAWLQEASYHARLAVAIAALAPKLRLGNILALTWDEHLDPALQWITVHRHKTAARTRKPLVTPISDQLRGILLDARRRQQLQRRECRHVVQYRNQPIRSLRAAIRAAARDAGLPYGRAVPGGVTFHTLRHTAATLLAELDIADAKRRQVMGHSSSAMTDKYTHLRPVHLIAPTEQLSAALPIADLVMAPRTRAVRRRRAVGDSVGTPDRHFRENPNKSEDA